MKKHILGLDKKCTAPPDSWRINPHTMLRFCGVCGIKEEFHNVPISRAEKGITQKTARELLAALKIARDQLIECGDQIHGQVDENTGFCLDFVNPTITKAEKELKP